VKYSEYFGAKGRESFKVKVFWRQRVRVILRMKISGVINLRLNKLQCLSPTSLKVSLMFGNRCKSSLSKSGAP
jgi:hypothetical protein